MDNTAEFRSIELCAGYGGIHLGLKRVIKNLRTVAFVEIEAFACANLVAKMEAGHLDAAPIWTDLKTFNAEQFRDRIHLITGGYPCQPFSAAGKRLGADDPRHLWPHIYKIVETIRPILCFFENVEGHLSLGFKEVQQSLRDLGYAVEGGIFSASECGAPQQRKRLFILGKLANSRFDAGCPKLWEQQEELSKEFQGGNQLAISGGIGSASGITRQIQRKEGDSGKFVNKSSELGNSESDNQRWQSIPTMHRKRITTRRSSWPSHPGQLQHEWEPPRVVANSVSLRQSQPERSEQDQWGRIVNSGKIMADTNSWLRAEQSWPNKWTISRINEKSRRNGRQIKPQMGGNSDGLRYRLDNAELYQSSDNRTDELRLCGNGVMPDVAEKAFLVLYQKISGVI